MSLNYRSPPVSGALAEVMLPTFAALAGRGKVTHKRAHLPGQHDQKDHGNWADGSGGMYDVGGDREAGDVAREEWLVKNWNGVRQEYTRLGAGGAYDGANPSQRAAAYMQNHMETDSKEYAVLHRGIKVADADYASFLASHRPGTEFEVGDLSSFSTRRDMAEAFSTGLSSNVTRGQNVVFRTQGGAVRGLSLDDLGFNSGAAEVLIPRTKFRVVDVRDVGVRGYGRAQTATEFVMEPVRD